MVEYAKFLRYQDALKHYKKQLDGYISQRGKIQTAYVRYLADNPHKQEKKDINEKIEQTKERIMKLIDIGWENYDGKDPLNK